MYQETTKGVSKAKNSALYNVLKVRPNKNMTATTFWATVVTVMYHYGNCYVYIARNKEPELLILDNRYMTVYDDNAKLIDDNGGVWYIYSEPVTGKVYKFSTDEILHFKTYMTFDGIMGLAVKDVLALTIDGAMDSQKFIKNLYETGLTGKVAVEYTADLNEELRKKLISTIETAASANSALTFIPIPAGMKLNPLNLKLTDAQFLELKKYTALQIAGAFGIKPNQINNYEKSSYSNSETQQLAFLVDTALYRLKMYEEEINAKVLSLKEEEAGYFYKFNEKAILRTDTKTQMEMLISLSPVSVQVEH